MGITYYYDLILAAQERKIQLCNVYLSVLYVFVDIQLFEGTGKIENFRFFFSFADESS